MHIFHQAKDLHAHLQVVQAISQAPIGFIPTMGALHEGHLALIRAAQAQGCYTVCSIFVNPTQFNDPSDLEKYPRTPEKDAELLDKVGCDVIFMPGVDEVYPPGADHGISLNFGGLDEVMEGYFRPGHFKGVAQVVKRLLDLVQPRIIFMGQKDFQQVAVVRHLIAEKGLHVQLIAVPTVREADGLAMSSRNVRLSVAARAKAPAIYQALLQAQKDSAAGALPDEISEKAMAFLADQGFRPEYFEVVDAGSLRKVETFEQANSVVACVATWLENVRLIDNIMLKEAE